MAEGAGDGNGGATGLKPGALSALLQEVAAAPEQAAEPTSLPPGALIGRFEIVRELGRGGFGVVYEAKDRDLGRHVAVKVVRPGRISEEEGKVSREAEAIARLAHPNLITLFDVGRSEHGPFLVFELLRGRTLQERMDDGSMPVQEAVHVATEVARGLGHAHAEGIVHRDLKPSNVFVTNRGQVKILDFGMAHAFGRRRVSGGTPAYMAPEQWEDAPEDERTDVFALGVMLYRMLTGEYPFPEGPGRWAAEPSMVPKMEVPGAPELAALVERMLDRTPTQRPRDGAAVLAALVPIEERLRTKPALGRPPEHAKRRKATFGDLLTELKRRHVFRVMVGYGIFAFAVLQVIEPIMIGAHLPDWTLTAVLVLLALGFPVVVILAWIFDLTAQGVKRTASASGPGAPSFGRSRLLLPLAASASVLVLAAVGAGGWRAWKETRDGGQRDAADGRTVVAVADFANGTGEPQLDAMTGLFVTSLEQSKKLVLLTRGRLVETARQLGLPTDRIDEVAGRGAGRRAGAAVLLVPTVHKLGGTYVVELRALDLAKDRYRFTVKETATSQDQLVELLDRLSDRARREMQETPTEVAGSRVALGTAVTHSLEAYQHYLRARQIRLQTCDYVAGAAEARKALELDPEMGAAHMELAANLMWLDGYTDETTRLFKSSRNWTARLPDKERRIVELDAFTTGSVPIEGDPEAQRQTVMRGIDELLARYPQDEYVAYFAGQANVYFARWDRALDLFRRALEMDPGQCYVADWAGTVLSRLGREEELLPIARRAVEARANAANLALLSAALRAKEPEEAARRAREAILSASPGQALSIQGAACTLAMTGHGEEAVSAARLLAREGPSESVRRWGRTFPAVLAAVQGRPSEAARLLGESSQAPAGASAYLNPRATILAVGRSGNEAPAAAAELRTGRDVLLKAGELALYGDLAGAASAAASLKAGSPPDNHYRTILSAVEGRWGDAIPPLRGELASLQEIGIGRPDARLSWRLEAQLLLGQGLVATGDFTGAVEVLRSADSAVLCGPQAAAQVPGMLVTRARAYEKLGRPADALKDLDRLLGLWKNAEQGLPLHAEAKALRARLGGGLPTSVTADVPSIAVLPFADMSPGQDQGYFADGMADQILSALAHVGGLRVVGRTSSFSFRGKSDDLKVIGQRLGVTNILEGSLRKDGDGIRVTAQLVRASDGTQLWSESFDRKLAGIFHVQDEIARAVAAALRVRLLAADRPWSSPARTTSPEAYGDYLLGRHLLSQETPFTITTEKSQRAVEAFERAIRREPSYAPAWAGLSMALMQRSEGGSLEDKRRALEAANRAVSLAPDLADGYLARAGLVQVRGWDWAGSLGDVKRAIDLAPQDPRAYTAMGNLLRATGRVTESLPYLRRGTELDPLDVGAWFALVRGYANAGKIEEQILARKRLEEIKPESKGGVKNAETAVSSQERAIAIAKLDPGTDCHAWDRKVRAHHLLGQHREAAAALEEQMALCGRDSAWQIALDHCLLGSRDLAFAWLERAYEQMDAGLFVIKLEGQCLRGDPRYAAMLRKMNLPVD